MLPLACQPFDPAWQVHSLGEMTVICSHCHALHWLPESLSHSTNNNIRFGMCCLEGKISLEPLHPAPPELLDFLTRHDPVGNAFRHLIRNYNSALAMTSVGRDVNRSINQDGCYDTAGLSDNKSLVRRLGDPLGMTLSYMDLVFV